MDMTREPLRIGSRGSELALWQSRWVQHTLRELHPDLEVSVEIIKTTGDRILDAPLSKIGDKGLFTREIELALLQGRIDLAVHSLKDLPTELPAGLLLGAVCEREDPRDVFVPHRSNPVRTLEGQPPGARVATGSLRRKCQLLSFRGDLAMVEIRGNLQTRLRKLDESDWHGMLLARAGVVRLGLHERIGQSLPLEVMLPAVGQGALGIEVRNDDARVLRLTAGLIHDATLRATLAERALLRRLEGGCQIPIGAHGRLSQDGGSLILDAVVGSLDGTKILRGHFEGASSDPESIGVGLAEQLLGRGADEILRTIRGAE
jgi:hydroxymethylbilane synthase